MCSCIFGCWIPNPNFYAVEPRPFWSQQAGKPTWDRQNDSACREFNQVGEFLLRCIYPWKSHPRIRVEPDVMKVNVRSDIDGGSVVSS
jgi:hypothetical protein